MQRALKRCIGAEVDLSYYDTNRKTLYDALIKAGYECIYPDGAFYLFVKSPIADEKEFCQMAKKYNILIVPGSAFGCPGFFRISYCVSKETVLGSIAGFEKVIKEI